MKEQGEFDPRRIDRIEARLDDFQNRLESLEKKLQPATPPSQAPSKAAYVPPPIAKPAAEAPRFDFQPASPPPSPPKEKIDAEAQFGSVVLPRIGAGVVLLGIAYLVSLGIAQGWITVLHQFWGAIALCGLSIGIGLWKRAEGFDFGQVLIGLGSCGLYLTFAGGHVFLHLYEGEALVSQFVLLSLANLLYGAWSPSKTFVGIGLLGGLAASLMPLEDKNVAMAAMLHGLIVLPACFVIAQRRWPGMALGGWGVSTLALLPVVLADGPWKVQSALVYGASLAGMAAYAWANRDWEFDPGFVFLPFATVVSGLIAHVSALESHAGTTVHVLWFGAALGAMAAIFRRTEPRQMLALGAVLAPMVFAPLGLAPMESAWTYLGLGAAALLVSLSYLPKALFGLGVTAMSLAAVRYGGVLSESGTLPVGLESAFLLAGIAAIALAAVSANRWLKSPEAATAMAAVAIAPAFARIMTIQLAEPPFGASVPVSLTIAALIVGGVLTGIANVKKWGGILMLGWCALFGAFLGYGATFEFRPPNLELEIPILVATIGILLMASRAIHATGGSREAAGVVGAITIMPAFARLVFIGMTGESIGMSGNAAMTFGGTLYAALVLIAGFAMDLRGTRITALTCFGLTLTKVLLVDLVALDPGIRVALIILLGMAMIAGGYWYVRRTGPTGKPPAVAA